MRTRLLILTLLLSLPGSFLIAQSSSAKKSSRTTKKKKQPASTKATKAERATRLQQAFIASADLKSMASQLFDTHSAAAYKGVEGYARKHDGDDAGALAWLVLGYAYITDDQPQQAIAALTAAQKHAGEMGDYVEYLLGQALQATGRQADAARTLKDFSQRYPRSLLVQDAAVIEANALIATGLPDQAAAALEARRAPARADVELVLGRAYEKSSKNAKAAESFRLIYYTMPLSGQADSANTELQLLSSVELPSVSHELRRRRAELLYQGRQYANSADEYRGLLDNAPSADLRRLQVAYGTALYKAGRYKDARLVLEQVADAADEINAQRIFYLSELTKDDSKRWVALVNQLRDTAPASPWLSEALLAAGNRALLRKDYGNALSFYQEAWTRSPQGKYASYAHWKNAWLVFRMNRTGDAKRLFEEQISNYPAGIEVPAALYWRARLGEEGGESAKARAYYLKLIERYKFFYYGELASERLRKLKYDGPPANDLVLAKVPPLLPALFAAVAPAENVRVQRALVLENGSLLEFAIRELQAAGSDPVTSLWAQTRIARIYLSQDREYRALQVLKRAIPSYYSYEISQMPRPVWEVLFPKIYWPDLTKHATANNLDPFLVAALIRQESEFNPSAVSRANAIGLMQLLPSVGKKLAKDLKLKGYSNSQLTVPNVNLQLGSTYFRQMLDKYDGQVEYALAAYNAGSDRVQDWRGEPYRDIVEFVENIPFTETREYVQAIQRNVGVYRRLYATP
ncbi:MAG: transglycosylase SLT domain-containing protein [Candidatus Koribacter versatilis]|uniref:Transglycosylase SLT domain-containing protein n=1 Tax=Candidatus Korobacter versatilis TaxID=658062 RepID=A0A932A6C6_9BACT|nr:transglycosylase SLT domain-containing protein [Candidatus Koribacter versatilis]